MAELTSKDFFADQIEPSEIVPIIPCDGGPMVSMKYPNRAVQELPFGHWAIYEGRSVDNRRFEGDCVGLTDAKGAQCWLAGQQPKYFRVKPSVRFGVIEPSDA